MAIRVRSMSFCFPGARSCGSFCNFSRQTWGEHPVGPCREFLVARRAEAPSAAESPVAMWVRRYQSRRHQDVLPPQVVVADDVPPPGLADRLQRGEGVVQVHREEHVWDSPGKWSVVSQATAASSNLPFILCFRIRRAEPNLKSRNAVRRIRSARSNMYYLIRPARVTASRNWVERVYAPFFIRCYN